MSDEAWAGAKAIAESVDRKEKFVTGFIAPGIFEKLHYLMGIQETLINFYEEPEAMLELIDFLADWEIQCFDEMVKHINQMHYSIMMTGEARFLPLSHRRCLKSFLCRLIKSVWAHKRKRMYHYSPFLILMRRIWFHI